MLPGLSNNFDPQSRFSDEYTSVKKIQLHSFQKISTPAFYTIHTAGNIDLLHWHINCIFIFNNFKVMSAQNRYLKDCLHNRQQIQKGAVDYAFLILLYFYQ